jgi:hypothetical protein
MDEPLGQLEGGADIGFGEFGGPGPQVARAGLGGLCRALGHVERAVGRLHELLEGAPRLRDAVLGHFAHRVRNASGGVFPLCHVRLHEFGSSTHRRYVFFGM